MTILLGYLDNIYKTISIFMLYVVGMNIVCVIVCAIYPSSSCVIHNILKYIGIVILPIQCIVFGGFDFVNTTL